MNKWFVITLLLFTSCAYFTKDSAKECEEIIEENRLFRQDCFELVDDQDNKIGQLQQEVDSLKTELEKCRN
jgi:hypothetical protein